LAQPRATLAVSVAAGVVALMVLVTTCAITFAAVTLPGCDSCHLVGDFGVQTRKSDHAAVECKSCHIGNDVVSRVAYGTHVVTRTAVNALTPGQRPPNAGRAQVADPACLACHAAVNDAVVTRNGVRVLHSKCAVGSQCTDCHSTTAHGTAVPWPRTYSMDKCLHCHGQNDQVVQCDKCHEGRRAEDRLARGPWAVTHGTNWRKTHGMGDQFTCAACHPKGYCDRCHGPGLPHGAGFMAVHSRLALAPAAKCDTCHKPAFCTGCHGLEMPHPDGFAKTHAEQVKRDGETLCRSCHSEQDCTQCHTMHIHPGGAGLNPPQPKSGGQ
jgi:hypothetical protein